MISEERWLKYFAGEPAKIDAERRRLVDIRDLLWSAAEPVRVDSWTGAAADRFATVMARLVKACRRAGDSYDLAARALDQYQNTLTYTQELAHSALADIREAPESVRAAAAHESLPRWRDQLWSEGRTAAEHVGTASAELAQISRILPDLPEPAPPAPADHRPPEPAVHHDVPQSQPLLVRQKPVAAPGADLLSMLAHATVGVVAGLRPVATWAEWRAAPGRQTGRFGDHD